MILGAGVSIGSVGLSTGQIVVTIVVFTIVSAASVAAPVVVYRLVQEKAHTWLASLKTWLISNNATVMMTLFLVIGVVLIGKGIGTL
jgi:Sap, sulfolipid-1-addressing protein